MNSDGLPAIIRNATGRGVSVSVYTDSGLNQNSDGTVKPAAAQGVSDLLRSGARVYIANGIHNKTLIRDNDLIAEGSFNWLSAVRKAGAVHQREERTMVVEGKQAEGMVKEEVGKLEGQNIDEVAIKKDSTEESGGIGFGLSAIGAIVTAILFITGNAGIGMFVGAITFVSFLFLMKGNDPVVTATSGVELECEQDNLECEQDNIEEKMKLWGDLTSIRTTGYINHNFFNFKDAD